MSNEQGLTVNLSDQLAAFPVSRLNGPGLRYCLWVQGCSVRCTDDCLNPELLEPIERVRLPVAEIANYIAELRTRWGIEGVTYLGGEPSDQAEALAELGRLVHAQGLTVVTYTGRTIEMIRAAERSDWDALLAITDILIDGPFVKSRASDCLRWRGSANQRLLFLTNAYDEESVLAMPLEKGANVIILPNGVLKISGIQNKTFLDEFCRRLAEHGVIY